MPETQLLRTLGISRLRKIISYNVQNKKYRRAKLQVDVDGELEQHQRHGDNILCAGERHALRLSVPCHHPAGLHQALLRRGREDNLAVGEGAVRGCRYSCEERIPRAGEAAGGDGQCGPPSHADSTCHSVLLLFGHAHQPTERRLHTLLLPPRPPRLRLVDNLYGWGSRAAPALSSLGRGLCKPTHNRLLSPVHLLRQRTRLRDRPKLLRIKILFLRSQHLVERGPDE